MRGTCFNYNAYGEVTEHHLFDVKDLQKTFPEFPLKKLTKVRKKSPIILLCRKCHDNFEHQKKIKKGLIK